MEPAQYTDPLEEALSTGSQRVAQVASVAAAMAQVITQHRALAAARRAAQPGHDGAQVLHEQERLLHQRARLSWAPANDPQWLRQAGLLQTASVWAAAAAYAPTDPTARAAMRKSEVRLRTLHPYAMARYDRLRTDRTEPLDAMREAAPLFARAPTVRVGDPPTQRATLAAGTGQESSVLMDEAVSGAGLETEPGNEYQAEARGQQIIDGLQSRARVAGRPELGPDELATVLETTTNLPHDVIERLIHRPAADHRTPRADGRHGSRAPDGEGDKAAILTGHAEADLSPAGLAAQSFPCSVTETVQAASESDAATQPTVRTRTPGATKRPSRSA